MSSHHGKVCVFVVLLKWAREAALVEMEGPVTECAQEPARAFPTDGAVESRLLASGPGGVACRMVDEQGSMAGEGGAGAEGTWEALQVDLQ